MSAPLLRRAEPDDFKKRWTIPSRPNLRVDAEYDEERGRKAVLRGYSVVDTRFSPLHRQHLVRTFRYLADVRDWVSDDRSDRTTT